MARGIAHVTLVGNLTRDPELKQISTGSSVCDLGVAVGRSYKDSSGQWQDKTSFFNVKVWGPQGENCAKYLSKGRQVAVDGRLEQRSWETEDGSKRSVVDIIADTVMFLGGQGDGGGAGQSGESGGGRSNRGPSSGSGDEDFRDIDFSKIDDEDDIPF
ncbi:MAG: single-stranded DNA-binding protein [Thermoleophilia bacterium]